MASMITGMIVVAKGSPEEACEAAAPSKRIVNPAYAHSLSNGVRGRSRATTPDSLAIPKIVIMYAGRPNNFLDDDFLVSMSLLKVLFYGTLSISINREILGR